MTAIDHPPFPDLPTRPPASGLALRGGRAIAMVLILLGLVAPPALAQRLLHWPAMEVEARLDSAGVLHVRERQVMAFTGDWNGGERTFNVRNGQRLTLQRLARLDSATGTLVDLREGDLDAVDEYAWGSRHVLRWRSRLPTDPPFLDRRLTYDLEYTLGNILVPRDSGYVLDHDFAFPQRDGVIERFTLALTIDPAWVAPGDFTGRLGADSLQPGSGYVVTLPLRYARAGVPAGVVFGAPRPQRLILLAALGAALLAMLLALWRREQALGRFAPLVDRQQIDEEWLQRHVLHMLPEAVGAAWDNHTAGPEVAAVLARLVVEKKLSSEVKRVGWWVFTSDVLHLRLLVNRNRLVRYERALIDALFEPGSDVTDTASIRQRYRKSGFNPATTIEDGIERIVGPANPSDPDAPAPSRVPTLLLLLSGVTLLVVGGLQEDQDVALAILGVLATLLAWVLAGSQALAWRHRVHRVAPHALRFLVPLGALVAGWAYLLLENPLRIGLAILAGLTLVIAAMANSVCNAARSRQGAERIATRKRLAAGREYFKYQLQQEVPALKDPWFPWLIAFGLGPHMDRWFSAFGGASSAMRSATTAGSLGSHGGSSSGSGSWSGFGGGGGFSGGGSSGSFATAVGVMAAGVSKPSSGSSGGGGGGGGSSGGGGGGGW